MSTLPFPPPASPPPGDDLPSLHPIDIEGSQPESGAEPTDNKKVSRPKRGFLRRHRSTSSVDNRSPQRQGSLPPANSDGTRPWARYLGRSWTAGSLDGQPPSPSLIQVLMGTRQRRNSDAAPPSAFTPMLELEPASPLAGSATLSRTLTNTSQVPKPSSEIPLERPKVLFYNKHEPYYGFTNFSSHAVKYKGKIYPTSEHLFQSLKFTHRPNLAEHIRTCSSRPSSAFSEARRFAPEVRGDWSRDNVNSMDKVLYHKFTQHKDLRRELLSTGNAELIENSDKDAFWGCGADGKGSNELGKALERLRDQLRKEKGKRW